jgi:prophage regulatory protein
MQTLPSDPIIRLKTVLARTGLSRSTLYRRMRAGAFPRNVQISERCVGWRESTIDAWLRSPMCFSETDAGSDLSRDIRRLGRPRS